ncbi:hypothetical protein AAY473_005964 [Plecturocebus cupreus]
MVKLHLYKNTKTSWVCWCTLVSLAIWEAEVGGVLGPGRQRLQFPTAQNFLNVPGHENPLGVLVQHAGSRALTQTYSLGARIFKKHLSTQTTHP